ncbi:hypothetical protein P7K49_005098, partial [Saguinus oedipus]
RLQSRFPPPLHEHLALLRRSLDIRLWEIARGAQWLGMPGYLQASEPWPGSSHTFATASVH